MEFVGLLEKKIDEREGTTGFGPYKVATFLLSEVASFPKHIVVDVMDGEIGRIAQFEALLGQNVIVDYDVEAKESRKEPGRWFNTVRAWKIRSTQPEPPKNESG